MATAMKKCKVCGCEYEYCHTVRRVAGVFRWQDVACSPEHGSVYLAKVEASRSGGRVAKNEDEVVDEKIVCDVDIEEDEDFDDDDDDEEDPATDE